MVKEKIIWDFFGGSNNSVGNALKDCNVKIITFDITKTCDYYLDMSGNFSDIKKELNGIYYLYGKPDIIVGSPLCNSFSNASCMIGGNGTFKKDKFGKLYLRDKLDYKNHRYNYESQNKKGKIGISCLENYIKVLEWIRPDYWYIENPKSSYMWTYLKNNINFIKDYHNLNSCNFGNYGNYPYKKPTIFLSNVKMDLLEKKGSFVNFNKTSAGKGRSIIPNSLLVDIFSYFGINK